MRQNSFIISDCNISVEMPELFRGNEYKLSARGKYYFAGDENLCVFVSGYVLPSAGNEEYGNKPDYAGRILEMYNKYGDKFINRVKGIFTIIICKKDNYRVFNDHFGLSKYFRIENPGCLFISDSYSECVKRSKKEISKISLGLFALTHHFSGGHTIYKDIKYSAPAIELKFENGKYTRSKYWSVSELHELWRKPGKLKLNDIHDANSETVKNYQKFIPNKGSVLTLTAGFDSRYILSALLKNEGVTHTISYGNPDSIDIVLANKIAEGSGIKHSNYFLPQTAGEYSSTGYQAIELGEGLAHFHRAHRLFMAENAELEGKILFTGHNGGETIRGLSYNNYFDSGLLKDINSGVTIDAAYIKNKLVHYFIKVDEEEASEIYNAVNKLSYTSDDQLLNKFYFLYDNVASLHHFQDIDLYSNYAEAVVPFYLDIDILRNIYQGGYNLFELNTNFAKLLFPKFYSTGIARNYPTLGKYPMSRNYSPDEFNRWSIFIYLIKKIRDKNKKSFIPNYSYKGWYKDFAENYFSNNGDVLEGIIDYPVLKEKLKSEKHKTTEGYWLRYSDVIYFEKLLTSF